MPFGTICAIIDTEGSIATVPLLKGTPKSRPPPQIYGVKGRLPPTPRVVPETLTEFKNLWKTPPQN